MQLEKSFPALSTCSGLTVISIVSVVKQLPVPNVYTIVNVPSIVGSKIPPGVIPLPDQVPPAGAPIITAFGASIHNARSLPASAGVGAVRSEEHTSELQSQSN